MNKSILEFSSTIEQRLYETSKFWSDCDENYHELKEFIPSLNALIQSLRNLTFIVQSYKSIIPDFDSWYSSKQIEMRNDIYLRWAHEARNTVVKSSNLKLKSKTTIELLNWESHPVQSILTDPLDNNTKIKSTILTRVPKNILVAGLREPLVRIERYWIADNLPEKELLWLTAYCYRYFKKIAIEIYGLLDLDVSSISTDFEKSVGILNANTLFESKRTVILDLKDMKRISRKYLRVGAEDKELEMKARKRYGDKQPKHIKKKDEILDWFEFVTAKAKQVLGIDGHHVPMAFLFGNESKPKFYTLDIRDRAELYYMLRKLGDDVLENKYKGAVIISETWMKNLNFEIKGEAVMVAVVKKGLVEVRIIPFERHGKKVVVKPMVKMSKGADFPYLKPIIDAIEAVGKVI